MKLNITAIADRMIWFITLIFLVLSLTISFALGDANYGAYVLFVCLFGLIIFYLIREQGVIKFRLTWMHGYMLLFIGACYLSTINAIEPSVAFSRSFDIVKIFFMLIILYMCYQDKKSVDTLLKIGMWTGYIVCFYTVYFYGLDYFITVLSSSARIANDALNANTVGLLGANAIVMTLYYMLYDRPRWWHIIALPTLGILAATGSRKALVFVVAGIVLLFIFKSLRSANVVNSIVKIIGSLLALTIVGIAVLQLPMFSEVLDRMSSMVDAFSGTGGDSSTIIRMALVDIGWDLFYQSPITGVGANNPSVYTYFLYGKENYYLHNNYIELLAGTGVIGLLAYYSMYIYIAYNLIRYRDFHSNEYVMVLILFLSQIVMDMGMVSYESKSTYFYMMLFYLEVLSKLCKVGMSFLTKPYYRTRVLIKLGYYDSLSDEEFLKKVFPKYMGYPLDLENPKTFSEKLQWLKVNYREPIQTVMVDKHEAKHFIAQRVGDQYIIPTLAIWDSVEDIDFDALPNQFVLKCTHDSGGIVICKDKSSLDRETAKAKLSASLQRDYSRIAREWPYKDVPRRIIAEEYLSELGNNEILDYKMYCFHGEPKITVVCSDRFSKTGTRMNFYDINWKPMGIHFGHYPPLSTEFPRPETYDEMLRLAMELSKDCPFLRVDFYEIKGRLYIGELTFFPGAGLEQFRPITKDYELGEWLHLETVHRG